MRKVLYEVTVHKIDKIKIRKKFLFFHIKVKRKEVYKYWIEFRVDEKRFWYGEKKPVYNADYDCYEIKSNTVLTKNGCEKSIKILDGICDRVSSVFSYGTYSIEKNLDSNWKNFIAYDKIDNQNTEHKPEIKGMFLT